MRQAGITLMMVAGVAFVLSPIVYHWRTRGAWLHSWMGRHLMSYMGVMGMVMVLAMWAVFFGPLPPWMRPLTWGCIALVAWWRLVLIFTAGHHRED